MEHFRELGSNEKMPEVRIHLKFAPHESREDAAGFNDLLKQNDVYSPEFLGGDKDVEDKFNELSKGNISPEEFIEFLSTKYKSGRVSHLEFIKEIADGLFNSHKAVILVDPGQDFMTTEYDEKIKKINADSKENYFVKGKFREAIDYCRFIVKLMAEENIQRREEAIIKKLKDRIPLLKKDFPELDDKDTINLLITFGSAHTSLFQLLKKEGFPVTRSFNQMPYQYAFMHEAVRRHQYGKEISDELVSRALFEVVYLQYILKKFSSDHELLYRIARKVASGLSYSDIEGMSKKMGERIALPNILNDLNVPLPLSQDDFDSLVLSTETSEVSPSTNLDME